MKRVLSMILVFALVVPVLLVPARAVEEYVFEWVNPEVMTLDDSVFYPEGYNGQYFVYEGNLPDGIYSVDFVCLLDSLLLDSFDLSVQFIDTVDGPVFVSDILVYVTDISDPFNPVSDFVPLRFTFTHLLNNTILAIEVDDGEYLGADAFSEVHLTKVADLPDEVGDSVSVSVDLSHFNSSLINGLVEYNTANLATWIVAGLGVAAAPVICWFCYRWIRRKLKQSYFKGRL